MTTYETGDSVENAEPESPCLGSLAVNGDSNPKFENGSCFHTKPGPGQYFEIDLGQTYWISQILIVNRRDGVQYKANGLVVFLGC